MIKKMGGYGGDIGIGLLLLTVMGLIIAPIPVALIDLLLAVNLTISALLLMVVMYVPGLVNLSTFPTLLLFTTLFRLALNIATTKLILLTADAGHVVEAFGNLVVGGNAVVGFVVFLIITIVQFIVIAKGSERVAEVGARFTLDAMPGKQMSIDADLRAGLTTGDQARSKRELLGMESALHGGMDGAMKFVKGDAVAGLVITAINILGGITIGMLYMGMTAAEAANRFTVLSIGDAMVSQIPSLLICIAAGVLVTRVADTRSIDSPSVGAEIGRQLTINPKPLVLTGVLILGFAAIPGFPVLPFLTLSGVLFGTAYWQTKKGGDGAKPESGPMPALMREGGKSSAPTIQNKVREFSSPLEIRIAQPLSDSLNISAMDAAFSSQRDTLQESLGLPFPGIDVVIGRHFADDHYEVYVHDVPIGKGSLTPEALAQLGAPSREVALAQHALSALQSHAHLFIGVQEVQWMLEKAAKDYPNLVAECVKSMALLKIAEVMRRMLEEQVPLRNVRSILESLITWGGKEKDSLMLTEYVRCDLGRFLAHRASNGTGLLEVVMLDPALEQAVRQSIKQTPAGNFLALPPETMAEITNAVVALSGIGPRPARAVVTSMDIRRYVRKMLEKRVPWLQVYSLQELGGHVELRSLGRAQIG